MFNNAAQLGHPSFNSDHLGVFEPDRSPYEAYPYRQAAQNSWPDRACRYLDSCDVVRESFKREAQTPICPGPQGRLDGLLLHHVVVASIRTTAALFAISLR